MPAAGCLCVVVVVGLVGRAGSEVDFLDAASGGVGIEGGGGGEVVGGAGAVLLRRPERKINS